MRDHNAKQIRTVTQIIERHIMDLVHDTGISYASFIGDVRAHYETTFPEHLRGIEWSSVQDTPTRLTRDYEKFKRWFDSDVRARLPMEILESIIAAFPEDRRFKLQMELAHRQGMLAVPMPKDENSDDAVHLGQIGKETGEAIIAISKLLEDGVIDKRDRAAAPKALQEIDEAIAVMLAMKNIIQQKALGVVPQIVIRIETNSEA
jgi:hypothetical protein